MSEVEPEFLLDFSQFKDYCEEKLPQYLNDTDEELELALMNDTAMSYEEVLKLPESKVIIHRLIKLKECFINWYVNRGDDINAG